MESFNMASEADCYLVQGWAEASPQYSQRNSLRALWGRLRGQHLGHQEPPEVPPSPVSIQLRYTVEDISRLEREGQARRRDSNLIPNGHSMSQLLRAVGGYVSRKPACLVAVSWRDQSVSIVYETAQGRRELDNFRLDSVYDLWVHMSLRRGT